MARLSVLLLATTSLLAHLAAASCSVAGATQCKGDGIPDDFCCASGETCLVLASNTTVLCCPEGSSCTSIGPISCNVTLQNADLFPASGVMTTNLSGEMQTCADKCCPFGYSCISNGLCTKEAQQDVSPSASSVAASVSRSATQTSAVSIASATAASTSGASSSSTSSASESSSNNATADCHCDAFPTTAVVASFFPGLIIGAVLALGCICCLGRRNASKTEDSKSPASSSATSSFGTVGVGAGAYRITSPRLINNENTRTDFLRRKRESTENTGNMTPIQRVRSLFVSNKNRKSAATARTASTNISDMSTEMPQLPFNPNAQPIPKQFGDRSFASSPIPPLQTVNKGVQGVTLHEHEPSSGSINVAFEDLDEVLLQHRYRPDSGYGARENRASSFHDISPFGRDGSLKVPPLAQRSKSSERELLAPKQQGRVIADGTFLRVEPPNDRADRQTTFESMMERARERGEDGPRGLGIKHGDSRI